LSSTVFRTGGKKLLSKGHVLSDDDIRLLQQEGMGQVPVTQLDEGEVGEDDAVVRVAQDMGVGCFEIRLAAGGRSNLLATEPCCVLIDDELLKQINCTASVAIATCLNFSYAATGQRISTVKSAPFAVPADHLETVTGMLKERGPIIQARPIRDPAVAVLYTDPHNPERAKQLFEPIMTQRLERLGTRVRYVLAAQEDEPTMSKAIAHLLRSRPTVILIASTTAPAGPDDIVGRSMLAAGCDFERFLAPVEPGNLLLLGYSGDIPVVSAPGCFRSAKPNVVDLVLPPILARYRVSGWEIACLGHGGLLA
jgi:molybdenum cofactor cytidylyltransferase